MKAGAGASLERGRQEIGAARALLQAGFPSQAVSRAYMAGLHAAQAALLELGEVPHTRTGVVSAFGRRVVREDGLEHEAGRRLRRLRENRDDVDYGLATAPDSAALAAIDDAELLVAATEDWMKRRVSRS